MWCTLISMKKMDTNQDIHVDTQSLFSSSYFTPLVVFIFFVYLCFTRHCLPYRKGSLSPYYVVILWNKITQFLFFATMLYNKLRNHSLTYKIRNVTMTINGSMARASTFVFLLTQLNFTSSTQRFKRIEYVKLTRSCQSIMF